MTCIVAIVDDDKTIYMGGDSRAGGIRNFKNPKVFKRDGFVMGFTSSWRMGQLLEYKLEIPELTYLEDPMRYMVVKFVPALMKCFKDNAFSEVENNVELGGTFLIGFKGNIFVVNANYQVEHWLYNYAACGCGVDIALGSLFSTDGLLTAKGRVIRALEAATEFSDGVKEPFKIEILKFDTL